MMKLAIVFGYNEYAKEVAKQINGSYEKIYIYTLKEIDAMRARGDGFEVALFQLDDHFEKRFHDIDIDDSVIFCALGDDAQNIFLTISLRESFDNMHIIALSSTDESADKLKMAGADKVIPKLETTASVIHEMLEKPIVNKVLHDILYEESDLQIAQIKLNKDSLLVNRSLHDITLHKEHNLIILAVVDHELEASFSFTAKGYNHHLDENDILVVVGYDEDIKKFIKAAGGNDEKSWDNWRG